MVACIGGLADGGDDLLVALDPGPGADFFGDIACYLRLAHDSPHVLHRRDELVDILWRGQEIRIDRRMACRVGVTQPDGAKRFRAFEIDVDLDTRLRHLPPANEKPPPEPLQQRRMLVASIAKVLVDDHWCHKHLCFRQLPVACGVEQHHREQRAAPGPRPVHKPASHEHGRAVEPLMPCMAEFGEVGPVLHRHIDMIGKMFADARKIDNWLDAMLVKMRRRPDAGQHQQLRRAERALADDDLPARRNDLATNCLDGARPPVRDPDFRHLAVCEQGDI